MLKNTLFELKITQQSTEVLNKILMNGIFKVYALNFYRSFLI